MNRRGPEGDARGLDTSAVEDAMVHLVTSPAEPERSDEDAPWRPAPKSSPSPSLEGRVRRAPGPWVTIELGRRGEKGGQGATQAPGLRYVELGKLV